ncbi:hypothetical protein [Flindersiella endophytica]
MAESSSAPQSNQPPRPRQNQPAKKGNPLGCLLPLGIAAFFFAQQYLPSWSWVIVFGFIFVAIFASSASNAKKKRQRAGYPPGVQPGVPAQQGGPQIASTQFPPPQPQPQYRPQYVVPPPPPPQQIQVQRPQPKPQPAPQPRPQPRPQAQPQSRTQPQPRSQPQPRPRMRPVPGTEHLAPALIGRVTDLKLKGQTVEAIETLREATAMELYEASQIVRRLGQPAQDPSMEAARDLDTDFGDLDTFDTSDPYQKADDELERKWKKADEELDRAWQRELELDREKWND